MNSLLLGGGGQVGCEIRRLTSDIRLVAPDRAALDLSDGAAIAEWIGREPWSAVINAAAYTEVDRAESEVAAAFWLNAMAPALLSAETGRRGIPLLHLSTDFVFDGRKGAPYVEDDPVRPLSVYGTSKEAGEQAVRTANPRHVILRTAWVFGAFRKNFVKTMLRLGAERAELRVVDDQRGCPTPAAELARACMNIARAVAAAPEAAPYGTYHCAGAGEATWCELARATFELAGERLPRRPRIVPIPTAEYPTPARRPADSRLDGSRLAEAWGIRLAPWREGLARTLDELLGPPIGRKGAPHVSGSGRTSGAIVEESGEQSGHIILSDDSTASDGLVAALQVLAVIEREGRPASEVCRRFEPVPQVKKSIQKGMAGRARSGGAMLKATVEAVQCAAPFASHARAAVIARTKRLAAEQARQVRLECHRRGGLS